MRGRDIAVLGVRFVAVYIVIFMATLVPSSIVTAVDMAKMEGMRTSPPWVAVYMFGPLAITIAIAVVLWVFAPTISGLVISGPVGRSRPVPVTAGNIRTAGLSAAGLVLFVYSALHLTRTIGPYLGMPILDLLHSVVGARSRPVVLQHTDQIAIGIWLFLRTRAEAQASSRLESPVE
jgi:hypothetical protein